MISTDKTNNVVVITINTIATAPEKERSIRRPSQDDGGRQEPPLDYKAPAVGRTLEVTRLADGVEAAL
jgi:hypothetical protein